MDLTSGIGRLSQLIGDHLQDYSFQKNGYLLDAGKGILESDTKEIVLEMIKHNLTVRPMIIEQCQLKPNPIDFQLGRPLIETTGLLGLDIVKESNSYFLKNQIKDLRITTFIHHLREQMQRPDFLYKKKVLDYSTFCYAKIYPWTCSWCIHVFSAAFKPVILAGFSNAIHDHQDRTTGQNNPNPSR